MSCKRDYWNEFRVLSREPLFTALVIWIILSIVWLVSLLPGLSLVWILVWSPTPAFLIFDYLVSRVARGGSGIFQNPKTGKTMFKGHGILLMFLLILIGTFVIDLFVVLFSQVSNATPLPLLLNAVVALWLVLWVDHHYYKHEKSTESS
jgi:hypothetical protein